MEKEKLEKLEAKMDKVIEQLEVLPVTSPSYDGLLSELRALEAKISALTASKSTFRGGITEYSIPNLR